MFMTFIGVGVALQSWGGILVILVLFGVAIGYRIHIEEKVMISELGDDYVQYMKRTKRLIPFVL
jgi:protein-S-isoprenylcysteine O-methyltransferase Ste14